MFTKKKKRQKVLFSFNLSPLYYLHIILIKLFALNFTDLFYLSSSPSVVDFSFFFLYHEFQ